MRKADLKCHGCDGRGHLESECPDAGIDASGKPPWCGQCDKKRRTLSTPAGPQRCHACHPLGRQALPQFRTCPGCDSLVYKWDRLPCESHITVRQITGAA